MFFYSRKNKEKEKKRAPSFLFFLRIAKLRIDKVFERDEMGRSLAYSWLEASDSTWEYNSFAELLNSVYVGSLNITNSTEGGGGGRRLIINENYEVSTFFAFRFLNENKKEKGEKYLEELLESGATYEEFVEFWEEFCSSISKDLSKEGFGLCSVLQLSIFERNEDGDLDILNINGASFVNKNRIPFFAMISACLFLFFVDL